MQAKSCGTGACAMGEGSNLRELEDLLRRKKQTQDQLKISWTQKRDYFIQAVDVFFEQIEDFLKPLQQEALLSTSYADYQIDEEYTGQYTSRQMVISFPDQKVIVTPIGANIVGAYGRIDMKGRAGEVKFLWVSKDAERVGVRTLEGSLKDPSNPQSPVAVKDRVWKIATPPPTIRFIELNEDTFSDHLLGVINYG